MGEAKVLEAGEEWTSAAAEFQLKLMELMHNRPQTQEEFWDWLVEMDELADAAERLASAIRRQNQALRELEG